MNYVKHSVLVFLYFLAYQFVASFLMVGIALKKVPNFPPQLIESIVFGGAIIGVILSTAFTIVLWKFIYLRKTIDYRVESSWFHKLYWPILLYIVFVMFQFLVPVSESPNQKLVVEFVRFYPVIAFFSVVIFAPILEELIFRGVLGTYFFPKMSNMKSVGLYLVVTGVIFSIIHAPATIPQFLIYLTMGINLGWIYLIKRDIRYPIVLHFINNFLSFLLIFMGR